MKAATTAQGRWTQLDGRRQSFIKRCERYAAFTLPKICPPKYYNQNNDDMQHDWQSVGAQCTNNLANKLMLAMFAPSRPFFRLEASDEIKAQMNAAGIDESKLSEILSVGEKQAVKLLDTRNLRPKLFEAIKHLIVVGNVLLVEEKTTLRTMALKQYVVNRSNSGTVMEIITKEDVDKDELEQKVRPWLEAHTTAKQQDTVCLFKWLKLDENGDMKMTQWVEGDQLPKEFNGKWPAEKCPYKALTWDLSDCADYGTGLVEEYAGDFGSLSSLSQSMIQAAILASEFRWLVNPAGMTRPEDMERSLNGAALPGMKDDMQLLTAGAQAGATIQYTQAVNQDYINRIGRGFLLAGTQIRNAERVTAEEITLIANELESSLGGVYSRLAVDFQMPIAYWLLADAKIKVNGSELKPAIVTGLDALSRNGDIEALKLWLADLASVATIPPTILGRLNLRNVTSALAAGRGIATSQYMIPEDQYQQAMAQAAQAQSQADAVDQATNQGPQ